MVATVADRTGSGPLDGRSMDSRLPNVDALRGGPAVLPLPATGQLRRITFRPGSLRAGIELEPGYSDAWAALTIVLLDEDRHFFNPRPNALDRALEAAQRAVELDAAEPAGPLRPGPRLLLPEGPGCFPFRRRAHHRAQPARWKLQGAAGHSHGLCRRLGARCRAGRPGAMERIRTTRVGIASRRSSMPTIRDATPRPWRSLRKSTARLLRLALCAGDRPCPTGQHDEAKQATDAVRRLWPDFEQKIYGGHLEKWMFAQPDLISHIVEGLEKAGLAVRQP